MADNLSISVTISGKDALSPEVQKAVASLARLEATAANGQRALTQMTASTNRASQAAKGLAESMGLGGALGIAGAAALVGAAVGRFATGAVQDFAAFERKVRETNALLGKSGDDAEASFQQMSRDLRTFSVRMGVDATQSARALYETISAGVPKGAEAMHVLEVASKAAIGGFTTTATAVNGLTSVLNAYQLQASEADRVAAQMFEVVNAGKLTFEQLSNNIGIVVPLASALGISFGELGGFIANTTAQGVRSEEAFTSLRALLASIARPTEEARKLSAALGLEWNAEALRARGLVGMLNDLSRATGNTQELIGQLVGDVNAYNAVLANTGANADKFVAATERMNQAVDSHSKGYAEVNQSLARQIELQNARWNDYALNVGKAMAVANFAIRQQADVELDRLRLAWGALVSIVETFQRISGAARTTNAFADEEAKLTANLAAGTITAEQYTEALKRLKEAQAAAARASAERFDEQQAGTSNATAAAEAEAKAASDSAKANAEAAKARVDAYEKAQEAAKELQRILDQQNREAMRAPEREAAAALDALQERARAAQHQEQRLLDVRARAIDALQAGMDAGRSAVDRLQEALSGARAELERLTRTSLEGTAAFADRLFGISQAMAANSLLVAQARAAHLRARLTGEPAPEIDRQAVRAAQRQNVLLGAESEVARLEEETTLAGPRRQLDRLISPVAEAPFDVLAAGVQAAQARITGLEPAILAAESRLREQQAAVDEAQRILHQAQLGAAEREQARQAELDEANRRVHRARLEVAAEEERRLKEHIETLRRTIAAGAGSDAALLALAGEFDNAPPVGAAGSRE